MKNMKLSALCAASVTGLVLSAATFAAGNAVYKEVGTPAKSESSAYKEAVGTAKSEYKSAVAICKDMKSEQRSDCMKDAKAEQKLALNKARDLRKDGTSAVKAPHAAPGAMDKEVSAKPLDLSAPASESAKEEAKPADAVTQ